MCLILLCLQEVGDCGGRMQVSWFWFCSLQAVQQTVPMKLPVVACVSFCWTLLNWLSRILVSVDLQICFHGCVSFCLSVCFPSLHYFTCLYIFVVWCYFYRFIFLSKQPVCLFAVLVQVLKHTVNMVTNAHQCCAKGRLASMVMI